MKRLLTISLCSALILAGQAGSANAGGNGWKRAVGAAIVLGVGAAIIHDLNKKKRKANRNESRNQPQHGAPANSDGGFSRDQAFEIQVALNRQGFDAGRPDGKIGRGTRSAISQYQASIGVPATGVLTYEQYQTLVSGPAPRTASVAKVDGDGHVETASGYNLAQHNPAMAALIGEFMADVSYYETGWDSLQINSDGTLSIQFYKMQDGKRTGEVDYRTGTIADLKPWVNSASGENGYLTFQDRARGADFNIMVRNTGQGREEAEAWVRRQLVRLEKMGRLTGIAYAMPVGAESLSARADLPRIDPQVGYDNGSANLSNGSANGPDSGIVRANQITSTGTGIVRVNSFQCSVFCTNSEGSDQEISFSVQAQSQSDAEGRLRSEGLALICAGSGYQGVGVGSTGDGVACQF
ncbi:MAG: peptidoglycan-binding domain-containing protein [Nitratireductor sp.]